MSLLDLEFKYRLNRVLRAAEVYFKDEIHTAGIKGNNYPDWAEAMYNRLVEEYGEDISFLLPEVMGLPDSFRGVFQSYILYKRLHQAQEQETVGVNNDIGTTDVTAPVPSTTPEGDSGGNGMAPAEQQPESIFDKLLSNLLGDSKAPGESNALLISDIRSYYDQNPGATPEEIYAWLIDPTRDDHWAEPYLLEQFNFDKKQVLEFIKRVIMNA